MTKLLGMMLVLFLSLTSVIWGKTEAGIITGIFHIPNMASEKIYPDNYQNIDASGYQMFLKESRIVSADIDRFIKVAVGYGNVKLNTIELGLDVFGLLPTSVGAGFVGLEIAAGAHYITIDQGDAYFFDGTGAVFSAQVYIESGLPVFGIQRARISLGYTAFPQGSTGRFHSGSNPILAYEGGGRLNLDLAKVGVSVIF